MGTKLIAGQRLLPGLVTRAIDANKMRIQQEVKMNVSRNQYFLTCAVLCCTDSARLKGAFRIHVMAGGFESSKGNLKAFDDFLSKPSSFVNKYRGSNFSSIIDGKGVDLQYIEHDTRVSQKNPFFSASKFRCFPESVLTSYSTAFLTVFSNPHTEWDIEDIPFHLRSYRAQVSRRRLEPPGGS